jgi:hypothetical protein
MHSTVAFHPRCDTGLYPDIKHEAGKLTTQLPELDSDSLIFGADGFIRKTGLSGAAIFISLDACGSVPLYLDEEDRPSLMAIVHNGELLGIVAAPNYDGHCGFHFAPSWEMDLLENESVADSALRHDTEGMLELIRMIEIDPAVQVATRALDFMVGIALCDKARLHGLSSQHAWAELSELQRSVIVDWLAINPHLADIIR